jgi:hypothetical protein
LPARLKTPPKTTLLCTVCYSLPIIPSQAIADSHWRPPSAVVCTPGRTLSVALQRRAARLSSVRKTSVPSNVIPPTVPHTIPSSHTFYYHDPVCTVDLCTRPSVFRTYDTWALTQRPELRNGKPLSTSPTTDSVIGLIRLHLPQSRGQFCRIGLESCAEVSCAQSNRSSRIALSGHPNTIKF